MCPEGPAITVLEKIKEVEERPDVYVLGALVIAHSRNANLCYVLSEPLKFNEKPPPTVT